MTRRACFSGFRAYFRAGGDAGRGRRVVFEMGCTGEEEDLRPERFQTTDATRRQDVDWNVEVEKEKLLEKTAAYQEGKTLVGKALIGRLDKDIALPLYETSLQHMDVENGGAKIMGTDGKKQFVTILPGIHNYDLHRIGDHDDKAQRRATVLIDAAMLTTK